jgi:hypothetical protein
MARPGNANGATTRHHTDTVRLVLADLDGVREQILADVRRQQSMARQMMEQARAAYRSAVEIDRLQVEAREALDALDARLSQAVAA